MKNIIITLMMIMVSSSAFPQELAETKIDDKLFLGLTMLPESKGYSNLSIIFSKKNASHFVKKLKSYCETTQKWTRKAHDNRVSNYRKPIPGSASFNHLRFSIDGATNTSDGYFIVPSFDVDDEGDCFLLLRGYYKGFNLTSVAVTTREGDKTRYQQFREFNYYLRIPSEELEAWYEEVKQAVESYETHYDKYESYDDIFK